MEDPDLVWESEKPGYQLRRTGQGKRWREASLGNPEKFLSAELRGAAARAEALAGSSPVRAL